MSEQCAYLFLHSTICKFCPLLSVKWLDDFEYKSDTTPVPSLCRLLTLLQGVYNNLSLDTSGKQWNGVKTLCQKSV